MKEMSKRGGATHDLLWLCRCVLALAVTLIEALNASTSVDKLLLAGEERVALVAEFERERTALAAASGELVAA